MNIYTSVAQWPKLSSSLQQLEWFSREAIALEIVSLASDLLLLVNIQGIQGGMRQMI